MQKPIIFMFSGQGSQYYHMAKELYNRCPTFRRWMLDIDDIVRRNIGVSVIAEIYNNNKNISDIFSRTLYTHPAIFMVEYSLAQVLLAKRIQPDYVLGTSLGELTAATISGVIEIEDAVECVLKQAEVFENYCKKSGMLAVICHTSLFYDNPVLFKNTELASLNYDSHFVVAGENEKLTEIMDFLRQKGIIHQLLPVSYGFHSFLIDPAEDVYKDFLQKKRFKRPALPFISCLTGENITEIPPFYFWEVVRKPVQFQKTILGLEAQQAYIYLDLGPSGTLANFAKHIFNNSSASDCYSIVTPFHREIRNLDIIENIFSI